MVETHVTCGTPTRWEFFFCIDCVTSMESVFSASSFWEAPRSAEVWFVHVKVNAVHEFPQARGRDCQGLVCVFWLDCDMCVRFRDRTGKSTLDIAAGEQPEERLVSLCPYFCMSCGSSSRENPETCCGDIEKSSLSRPCGLMARADTSCTDGRTVRENVCVLSCSFGTCPFDHLRRVGSVH